MTARANLTQKKDEDEEKEEEEEMTLAGEGGRERWREYSDSDKGGCSSDTGKGQKGVATRKG